MSIVTAAKHGNVLVLLDKLYKSGFASVSATTPMLTSKTMHTLYATSFLVYSLNCVFNWLYTYCILNGYVTSFPLRMWFIIGVVVIAVSGSMLCILLVVRSYFKLSSIGITMLCVENAFAHRLNITLYKSGLAVIWDALLEWAYSFNNFRVAFLFMILHDMPITISNFFLITACRCNDPRLLPWPLLMSVISTSISLLWRIVMLYFAYRRLIFRSQTRNVLPGGGGKTKKYSRNNSSFRSADCYGVPIVSLSNGPRLNETDETWPIRWASVKVYGKYPPKKSRYVTEPKLHNTRGCCAYGLSYVFFNACYLASLLIRRLAFLLLAVLAYICGAIVCCLPCAYFYFCRRNSFAHRHKCAKTCVRRCTFTFHYAALVFSLIFVFILLTLNVLLMDSTHIFGTNNFPPEINRLCLSVDMQHRVIQPFFRSTSPFDVWRNLWHRFTKDTYQYNSTEPINGLFDKRKNIVLCKPIWEDSNANDIGGWRHEPGPWQTRIVLDGQQILAVSTHFTSDYDSKNLSFDNFGPTHIIYYDFALLTKVVPDDATNGTQTNHRTRCSKRSQSQWHFIKTLESLGFPYFVACTSTIRLQRDDLIGCRYTK